MMAKITLDTESVLRDLAGQYAAGMIGTDMYLDMVEEVCRQSVQPTVED
jgi:hypothetical protein